MITELADSLYNFIISLNVVIERNGVGLPNLQQDFSVLNSQLDDYDRHPSTLYKELFEEWCKTDVRRFYTLTEELIAKDEEWSEKACEWLPDLGIVADILCNIADEISARRPDIIEDISTPVPSASSSQEWRLPSGLDTPEAWKIWKQAQGKGLISDDFRWLKGLELLACFAREMSMRLGLGKGYNSDGSPRLSWKPFEELFNIPRGKLRGNYNDIQKRGTEPSEIATINEIFEL